jgi:hypothetical protein
MQGTKANPFRVGDRLGRRVTARPRFNALRATAVGVGVVSRCPPTVGSHAPMHLTAPTTMRLAPFEPHPAARFEAVPVIPRQLAHLRWS